MKVWTHFDNGSCPGQAVGVRTRLDNGISGFISNRNISDKMVRRPEERVRVSKKVYFEKSLFNLFGKVRAGCELGFSWRNLLNLFGKVIQTYLLKIKVNGFVTLLFIITGQCLKKISVLSY